MALPLYLAMTAAEMTANSLLPPRCAYLSCHFSPWSRGLSNCPAALPEGAMLILDDSAPIRGHDAGLAAAQLSELVKLQRCGCILLDFQQPPSEESLAFVRELLPVLPCPVGVSERYAEGLDCPVFLPPLPLDMPLRDYLAPWAGREIWLDAAVESAVFTVDKDGCSITPLPPGPCPKHARRDEKLHCHYTLELTEDQANFTLYRTREDVLELLEEAESLGVKQAVGLWQELKQ